MERGGIFYKIGDTMYSTDSMEFKIKCDDKLKGITNEEIIG